MLKQTFFTYRSETKLLSPIVALKWQKEGAKRERADYISCLCYAKIIRKLLVGSSHGEHSARGRLLFKKPFCRLCGCDSSLWMCMFGYTEPSELGCISSVLSWWSLACFVSHTFIPQGCGCQQTVPHCTRLLAVVFCVALQIFFCFLQHHGSKGEANRITCELDLPISQ